jgi:hypothetical protein
MLNQTLLSIVQKSTANMQEDYKQLLVLLIEGRYVYEYTEKIKAYR